MPTTEGRVVAVFRHRAQAQRAVDALLQAGFDAGQITLTEPDHDLPAKLAADRHTTRAATPIEGGIGVAFGALLGAVAGGLTGRSLLGRTWLSVALWAALGSSAGAAGAAAVAFVLGRRHAERLPVEPVHYDEGSLERGRAMVTIDPANQVARAEEILLEYGGREPGKWRTTRLEEDADRPVPQSAIDNPASVEPGAAALAPTAEAITVGRDRV